MGNHIITLAAQAHNGEPSEPHRSKLRVKEKRELHGFIFRVALSFSVWLIKS
jgi:hypothetical protein